MLKKILKIIGVFLLIVIVALIAIPYFFEDEIKAKVLDALNQKVNATIKMEDAKLNLFTSFPNASIRIKKLAIINKAPFAGDTLMSAEALNLNMSLTQIFNGKKEPIKIKSFNASNALINIIFNEQGMGNYDIALKTSAPAEKQPEGAPLLLKIEKYALENSEFRFTDRKSNMKMKVADIMHEGTGDFVQDIINLDTKTKVLMSFEMNKSKFLDKVPVQLDALLALDMKKMKFTFKDNKGLIKGLPLEFDGFFQMTDDAKIFDLKFKTPTSDFKNFLGLIPEKFATSIEGVKTTGKFSVTGFAKGKLTDTTIPMFNISINSDNGSFQYPKLPKAVQSILIDAKIINETGFMKDTYLNVARFGFTVDRDVFSGNTIIKDMTTNPKIVAYMKGVINLANLNQAYPMPKKFPVSGIFNIDVTTSLDMESVSKKLYQNVKSTGSMRLSHFKYTDDGGKKYNISEAGIRFNPNQVILDKFNATVGKSDVSMAGGLDNFYGFLFKKQVLKGNFNLNSNTFYVSDFMDDKPTAQTQNKVETTTDTATAKKSPAGAAVKIPAFLDCSIRAKAKNVVYDKLNLTNAQGTLLVKNETVELKNVGVGVFDGQINANGMFQTKTMPSTFDMSLMMNKLDVNKTFSQLEMLKKMLPIYDVVNGKISAQLNMLGKMQTNAMSPDVNSLTGKMVGQFLDANINVSKSTLLQKLGLVATFANIKNVDIKNQKISLNFKDGKALIDPFKTNFGGINGVVSGSHSFDQKMNYNILMDVPPKMIASQLGSLASKISPQDLEKMNNVPVSVSLLGTFKSPKITTDYKQTASNLIAQIAKNQLNKGILKGKSAVLDVLTGKNPDGSNKPAPSKEELKKKAGELLKDIFH